MPGCCLGSGRWLVITSRAGMPPGSALTDDSQRWILPSTKCARASPKRSRQRLQRRIDQRLVVEIGEGERVGARDQPVENAVTADIVARAFVVDAAAAKGFRHEPGARDLVAPERRIEQDRNPQIVRRPVEISDVLDHRLAQVFAVPAHGGEPGMRQAHQHEIEIARLRPLAVHHVEPVAAASRSCRP